MTEDETAYYLRRAADELAKAEQARCPEAAAAHREMHRRYLAIVEQDCGQGAAEKPATDVAAAG